MGFWRGEIFANEHAADARDGMILGLKETIHVAVQEIEATHVEPLSGEPLADAQVLLVLVDTRVLVPAAIIAALVEDPVVRAVGPSAEEVERWRSDVSAAYAAIFVAERHSDTTRQPLQLDSAVPDLTASGEFWRVRGQETDKVFDRLATAAAQVGEVGNDERE
jgi:hypothetical protein